MEIGRGRERVEERGVRGESGGGVGAGEREKREGV